MQQDRASALELRPSSIAERHDETAHTFDLACLMRTTLLLLPLLLLMSSCSCVFKGKSEVRAIEKCE